MPAQHKAIVCISSIPFILGIRSVLRHTNLVQFFEASVKDVYINVCANSGHAAPVGVLPEVPGWFNLGRPEAVVGNPERVALEVPLQVIPVKGVIRVHNGTDAVAKG